MHNLSTRDLSGLFSLTSLGNHWWHPPSEEWYACPASTWSSPGTGVWRWCHRTGYLKIGKPSSARYFLPIFNMVVSKNRVRWPERYLFLCYSEAFCAISSSRIQSRSKNSGSGKKVGILNDRATKEPPNFLNANKTFYLWGKIPTVSTTLNTGTGMRQPLFKKST